MEENETVTQLRLWAMRSEISASNLEELLSILRTGVLPELPLSSKTFLRIPTVKIEIDPLPDANEDIIDEFVYSGMEKNYPLGSSYGESHPTPLKRRRLDPITQALEKGDTISECSPRTLNQEKGDLMMDIHEALPFNVKQERDLCIGAIPPIHLDTPVISHNVIETGAELVSHREFAELKATVHSEFHDVLQNQKHIIRLLESSESIQKGLSVHKLPFPEKHELELPIATMEEFKKFDKMLGTNKQYRTDFIASLHFLWIPKTTSITRQLAAILQCLLARNVALNFTSSKKIGGKLVMKAMNLNQCILDFFSTKGSWTSNEVQKALGVVLSNAKDWDGHRQNRSANSDENGV